MCGGRPAELGGVADQPPLLPPRRGGPGGGGQCALCGGTGRLRLTQCPQTAVPCEVWDLWELADLYLEHGLPPVAGGALDQTDSFLTGCRIIQAERGRVEKEEAERQRREA